MSTSPTWMESDDLEVVDDDDAGGYDYLEHLNIRVGSTQNVFVLNPTGRGRGRKKRPIPAQLPQLLGQLAEQLKAVNEDEEDTSSEFGIRV